MPGGAYDSDLTSRLDSLREVLHNEIVAVQAVVSARQDAQDSARLILLERLRSDTHLLQEELDRRFTETRRLMDERRDNTVLDGQLLQDEIGRRFEDARRETSLRFDSTIHMRVALQEEMDRRFTDLSSQLDRRFLDSERAVGAALAAAEKAVVKAEAASEKRFDAVNEFRQQQKDIIADFLTRSEYSSSHQSLADKLDAADKRITERLAALELRLTSRLDLGTGWDSGQDAVRVGIRANIATGVAILAVIVSVIILIVNITRHLGAPLFRRFTATALAAAGTLAAGIGLAATASAAPAHTTVIPVGWHRLGGLNEAGYCASATPRLGVAVAADRTNWDCTLTVRLPWPPGTVHKYKYQINQTDACRWEYPSHASTVRAIRSPASPPALGWSCYIPVV